MADAARSSNSRFYVGDVVRVRMPRGHNKRGVWGISVMYITSPEAKFDGATGEVMEVDPTGTHTIPLYLVDFRGYDNSRLGIPWQAQWFREEWLELVERPDRAVAATSLSGQPYTVGGEPTGSTGAGAGSGSQPVEG